MIVLPNSFEKYLNNLRFFTSISIFKHGILPKHLKNLKKIYLAEAFLFSNNTEPTNLQLLSYNILSCVKNFKQFDFHTKIDKNVLINRKLYAALILTLSHNISYIKVEFKEGIIIKGNGKIKNYQKLIFYLNGQSFFDIKTNNFLIYLPCENTPLPPLPTVTQWELLFDKFSVFNLFWE